ncbi:MAG TPA: hypothetical protein VGS12_10200 [Caulobacteraceae bacterium]|nr:hypothetical protein [Caulobacteraceae bacterium]
MSLPFDPAFFVLPRRNCAADRRPPSPPSTVVAEGPWGPWPKAEPPRPAVARNEAAPAPTAPAVAWRQLLFLPPIKARQP